jgi:hypothetical protein
MVVNIFLARFHTLRQFILRHWLTIAFACGFVTDFLLLNRVDDKFDNLVLFFYVVLATVSLVLFYVAVAERAPDWLVRILARFTPITMQYAFGGLLSGMLIFYGRSGDLLANAPFLLLIIGVIGSNELVKKRSERLLFNVSVYFIGVFSYCVLIVPVLLGVMGDVVFIGSGLLAVAVTMFLVKLLQWIIPNFMTLQKRLLVFSIGCLYMLFNGMYFFNFIPPIPLSLTELGIYQSVERTLDGNYRVVLEVKKWYEKIPGVPLTFNPLDSGGAACFARIYAPTDLKTSVVHRWEYKDAEGTWREHFVYRYNISGENKGGYRGFTMVQNLTSGKWRCSVENERGQVLGRRTFFVDTGETPSSLVTVFK